MSKVLGHLTFTFIFILMWAIFRPITIAFEILRVFGDVIEGLGLGMYAMLDSLTRRLGLDDD
jgi:hypothetical protein